ncbi:hypothetical protein DM02DRAFT_80573 [Periconia macrospinosa]|uniref:Uncharacterized protein n=1 Tax=Periconia macrospinosa TaxID=97972 RepID=A0A2V1DHA3_9PLEO|nr:hypothetical protein DM02DRAFT_80573 [Periconia macrospinosa]
MEWGTVAKCLWEMEMFVHNMGVALGWIAHVHVTDMCTCVFGWRARHTAEKKHWNRSIPISTRICGGSKQTGRICEETQWSKARRKPLHALGMFLHRWPHRISGYPCRGARAATPQRNATLRHFS